MRTVKLYELFSSAQTLQDTIVRNPKGLSTFSQCPRLWLYQKLLLTGKRLDLGFGVQDPTPSCNFI